MTLAGRCLFDEQLLVLDVARQIHRPGEREELDLVRFWTRTMKFCFTLFLSVRSGSCAPVLSSPLLGQQRRLSSLSSPFIPCSMPMLGAGDTGGFWLCFLPAWKEAMPAASTGEFKL